MIVLQWLDSLSDDDVVVLIIKATLFLTAIAGFYFVTHRRTSAATRHHLLTVGMLGLLLLPALTVLLPSWSVSVPVPALDLVASPTVETGEPTGGISAGRDQATIPSPSSMEAPRSGELGESGERTSLPLRTLIWGLYSVGALLLLGRLGIGWLAIRQLERRSQRVSDASWNGLVTELGATAGVNHRVLLLRTSTFTTPVTWGTRRPVILLPVDADSWSLDRKRAVLLHELAHIARRDCLTQTLASVASAVYWFHPGAWWVASRLGLERELACDDRVMAAGSPPTEYAEHLLEVARSLSLPRGARYALSLGGRSMLERRMRAILDEARYRAPAAGKTLLLMGWTTIVFLVGVATANLDSNAENAVVRGLDSTAVGRSEPTTLALSIVGGSDWIPEDEFAEELESFIARTNPKLYADGMRANEALWIELDRESRVVDSWVAPPFTNERWTEFEGGHVPNSRRESIERGRRDLSALLFEVSDQSERPIPIVWAEPRETAMSRWNTSAMRRDPGDEVIRMSLRPGIQWLARPDFANQVESLIATRHPDVYREGQRGGEAVWMVADGSDQVIATWVGASYTAEAWQRFRTQSDYRGRSLVPARFRVRDQAGRPIFVVWAEPLEQAQIEEWISPARAPLIETTVRRQLDRNYSRSRAPAPIAAGQVRAGEAIWVLDQPGGSADNILRHLDIWIAPRPTDAEARDADLRTRLPTNMELYHLEVDAAVSDGRRVPILYTVAVPER